MFASCNYVVELDKPMVGRRACNACSRKDNPVVHAKKSLHLRLDQHGDVFVADGILKLLKTVPAMAGLEVVDGRNPPPQFVGAVELPTSEIINANERFYVPGRTKYDAAARMHKPFEPVVNNILERIDRKLTAKKMEKSSMFIFGKRR